MSLNITHFPHMGPIEDPSIEDYWMELGAAEEYARLMTAHARDNSHWTTWRRWKATVRRLQWAHPE